jgi:imidazolonepropionase
LDEVEKAIPEIAQTGASALDIYVESVAFGNDDLRRVGEMARAAGLDLRAHVEQFNQNRSVPVAIQAGARSVDHLARLHADDLAELASTECAAVLLPGAEFLGDEDTAPARQLSDAGAICVLATDANPGTSPIVSMPLVIGLAVRRYGWSAREALAAATLNAAWVLRLEQEAGSIEVGKRADLLILDGPIEALPYRFGHNPVACAIVGGEIVHLRPDFESRVTG